MKLASLLLLTILSTNTFSVAANSEVSSIITLDEYIERAMLNIGKRCTMGPRLTVAQVREHNLYAQNLGLITAEAALWGSNNGFYPLIDLFTEREIALVCKA
ncbi:hypothetical protein [Pseudoalteromonas luteoviolacea]|uniref:Uncharacterized protein n=1 Tax=Pseudoalteromonas luteoviolacea H33 TaxID=1365251 RepID=A0A167DYW1_9GAMM|nr:hypothetical protein [Pseudoalteromonas luteoviolacea]KZN49769.1 hypothetical protein N476_18425 [Pseudoalteromonas luteoviolacea H33]KZN77793.1 hypothetical protein N477_00880 [Pseudoalteromonas luteoviolacea H33-S]MBQ4878724.1 hypothetical protein [Pseudoalteromonas luteoviolacea]MBQ4907868.1 hypothetical protein [Pseudoalteromonas luteoviolacea]